MLSFILFYLCFFFQYKYFDSDSIWIHSKAHFFTPPNRLSSVNWSALCIQFQMNMPFRFVDCRFCDDGCSFFYIYCCCSYDYYYYYWQPEKKLNCISAVKSTCRKYSYFFSWALFNSSNHSLCTSTQMISLFRFYCMNISFVVLFCWLLACLLIRPLSIQNRNCFFCVWVFILLFLFSTIICVRCTCCVYIGKSIEFH